MIQTIGWQLGGSQNRCCKCPISVINTGGNIAAAGYDLNNGQLIWGWRENYDVALGSSYVFTPSYLSGGYDSLDRISPSGARQVITPSASLMNAIIRSVGEAGDGTIGCIGDDSTNLVYSDDLTSASPSFTTESANTTPWSGKLPTSKRNYFNMFFGDTMYVIRDDGSAFDAEIERLSDGTTMVVYFGSGASSFNVPQGNSTYFLLDDGSSVFYGTFGDPDSAWTEAAAFGNGYNSKLTDNHFVWRWAPIVGTDAGDYRVAPLSDLSSYTTVSGYGKRTSSTPYTFEVHGDKVLLSWFDNSGGSGNEKITIGVYSDDGTEDWTKEISGNMSNDHAVCMIGATGGDIVLRCYRTSGTGAGHLLRRYSLSDGSLQWAVVADDMPRSNDRLQANTSFGQVVSAVRSGADTIASASLCSTRVDTNAESSPGA